MMNPTTYETESTHVPWSRVLELTRLNLRGALPPAASNLDQVMSRDKKHYCQFVTIVQTRMGRNCVRNRDYAMLSFSQPTKRLLDPR
jgi:hypothetical protein